MKKPKIWVSGILQNTEFQPPFLSHTRDDRPAFMAHLNQLAPVQEAANRGEPVDADVLPDRLFHAKSCAFRGQVRPATMNGWLYVRPEVADILRRHDLGHAVLKPVTLFQKEEATPVGIDLLLVTPGASIPTLDVGRTGLKPHPYNTDQTEMPFLHLKMSQKLFALPARHDGPCHWADPQIPGYPFFSDALKQELEDAGFGPRALDLYPVEAG